jgi:hypothetical protein
MTLYTVFLYMPCSSIPRVRLYVARIRPSTSGWGSRRRCRGRSLVAFSEVLAWSSHRHVSACVRRCLCSDAACCKPTRTLSRALSASLLSCRVLTFSSPIRPPCAYACMLSLSLSPSTSLSFKIQMCDSRSTCDKI